MEPLATGFSSSSTCALLVPWQCFQVSWCLSGLQMSTLAACRPSRIVVMQVQEASNARPAALPLQPLRASTVEAPLGQTICECHAGLRCIRRIACCVALSSLPGPGPICLESPDPLQMSCRTRVHQTHRLLGRAVKPLRARSLLPQEPRHFAKL